MKTYNYSNVDNFLNGVFKVATFTIILDVIFFIVKFYPAGLTFLFIFIIFSQIIALTGSIFVGLPVTIFLNKIGQDKNFIAAFICGLIVFLVVFFYLGDGKISHHNIKKVLFYTSYGICCGYAFMQGFNQASK